jgi:hypothetical protein
MSVATWLQYDGPPQRALLQSINASQYKYKHPQLSQVIIKNIHPSSISHTLQYHTLLIATTCELGHADCMLKR